MSEPTLYRTTVEPANIGHDGDERPLVLQEAIDIGALVPVEPDDTFDLEPVTLPDGTLPHTTWTTGKSRGEAMLMPGRYALVRIGVSDVSD